MTTLRDKQKCEAVVQGLSFCGQPSTYLVKLLTRWAPRCERHASAWSDKRKVSQ